MVHIPAILEKLLTPLASVVTTLNKVLEKYKKIVTLAFGTLAAILCLLLVVLFSVNYNEKKIKMSKLSETARTSLQMIDHEPSISIEDIFLPDEPDYLPEVILEQEPHIWSAEETRAYWTNPLENERINWRDTITQVVNDIMDTVP
ncbi:MAG: hypothetical protein LBP19_05990 [Treponema sp.]|jgi:hypothetical protein|nr:hypothetical protein [Treponema sp.]